MAQPGRRNADPPPARSATVTPMTSDPPGPALPAHRRPFDETPVHTVDLPPLPIRDRNIPAEAWIEAPNELLCAGADIGAPRITYKRRLGAWLLWRAGPAGKANSRYVAIHADDLERVHTFRIFPDGSGTGTDPDGHVHERFRTWKQALHASP